MEISVYKKLMESEEERLGIKTGIESLFKLKWLPHQQKLLTGDGEGPEDGSSPRTTPDVCRTGAGSPQLAKLSMTQTLL